MDALSGIRFGAQIAAAARKAGLDPRLLAAVAAQETGGPGSDSGRNVVGDGGHGRGLFQIDDRTWAFARTAAAMDPARNAKAAATILRDDLARCGGNVRAALSTYNAGSPAATGTTTTWGDGRTLGYADSVLRHYAALGGDADTMAADVRDASSGTGTLAALGAAAPAVSAAPSFAALSAGSALSTGSAFPESSAGIASLGGGASAATVPPMLQVDSQSPFAAPVSWASETSANGSAGGKEAADADGLVAASIDADDGVFDDRGDA